MSYSRKRSSGISKNFNINKLNNEEITQLKQEYKDNIFFTVGNPIQISDPNRSCFVEMSLSMKNRENIPHQEVFEAFQESKISDNLKLFSTEYQALEYSRSLRKGDQLIEGSEVFQPAIYKVMYFGKLPSKKEVDRLVINPGAVSNGYDLKERYTKVIYFQVKRSQVLPLEGVLKIHQENINEYITQGHIYYKGNKHFEEVNNKKVTPLKQKEPSFCRNYGMFVLAAAVPIVAMGVEVMIKSFNQK